MTRKPIFSIFIKREKYHGKRDRGHFLNFESSTFCVLISDTSMRRLTRGIINTGVSSVKKASCKPGSITYISSLRAIRKNMRKTRNSILQYPLPHTQRGQHKQQQQEVLFSWKYTTRKTMLPWKQKQNKQASLTTLIWPSKMHGRN